MTDKLSLSSLECDIHNGKILPKTQLNSMTQYVILSKDEYNKIVRQLNILTDMVKDMVPPRDGRVRALLDNSLHIK